MTEALCFIQLSDTHISVPGKLPMCGIDAAGKLRNVCRHILSQGLKPSFILITGDLTHDGDQEDYRYLKRLLDEEWGATLGVPIFVALGNHDLRVPFRMGYLGETSSEEPYYYTITAEGYRIVFLDSLIPGEVKGSIDDDQLSWLNAVLAEASPHGTIIVLHHPVIDTPTGLMDSYLLHNKERLAEAVSGKDVIGMLSGHVHFPYFGTFCDIPVVTAPGTSVGFDPIETNKLRFVDKTGYNIVTLKDGKMKVVPVILPGDHAAVAEMEL